LGHSKWDFEEASRTDSINILLPFSFYFPAFLSAAAIVGLWGERRERVMGDVGLNSECGKTWDNTTI